jgi:hypothetical protein
MSVGVITGSLLLLVVVVVLIVVVVCLDASFSAIEFCVLCHTHPHVLLHHRTPCRSCNLHKDF